ncbi:MAG: SynChlorMet cassette radical SAM/SPASM protein ScmF, partial [Candidatus Omnitrophica bacterium]|nr:SynChlorMet cassette radical SAM/SPASM protein ScmF [Candidatus Omnitrophota bacterium]
MSLDSPLPEIHDYIRGQSGSFFKTLKGISNLVKVGIRPQIIMTIMRCNYKDMLKMLDLAKKNNASSVKFNLVQPIARGEVLHKKGEFLDIEELIKLGEWVETKLYSESNLRIYYSHPIAFRHFSNIFSKKSGGFLICKIFNILGVLSDGFYALCGIGRTIPELIFGDAK